MRHSARDRDRARTSPLDGVHDHWDEQVASPALETDDGLVLIDPIDPPRSKTGLARILGSP